MTTTNHYIQAASAGTRSLNSPNWILRGFAVSGMRNRSLGIVFALALLAFVSEARAQFVEIQIDLPARSEVQSMGSSPAGQNAVKPEAKPRQLVTDASISGLQAQGTGAATALQWLGISVAENLQLIVEMNYRELKVGEKPEPAAYLNNGTTNTAQAVPISGKRAVFQVNNGGQLIRKMAKRPRSLTAWIGVPPGQTSELMIEYN